MRKSAGFKPQLLSEEHDDKIGNYYVVKDSSSVHGVGKIKYIDHQKGKIILNPSVRWQYDKEKGFNLTSLCEGDSEISVQLRSIHFVPISPSTIREDCKLRDKEYYSRVPTDYLPSNVKRYLHDIGN